MTEDLTPNSKHMGAGGHWRGGAAAGWVAVQLVGGKGARQPGWHAQRRRL